jgi:hypothetical protein
VSDICQIKWINLNFKPHSLLKEERSQRGNMPFMGISLVCAGREIGDFGKTMASAYVAQRCRSSFVNRWSSVQI